MKISIGICTKNNQQNLRFCLESVFDQKIRKDWKIEVVIVDSSDNPGKTRKTIRDVLELKRRKEFVMKYLYENKKGISFARNRIFTRSTGDLLFSLDDDITVSNNWISNGIIFMTRHKEVGIVGGKVKLFNKIPTSARPLLKSMNFSVNFWPYTLYDLGQRSKRLDPNIEHYPEFANMAIRKKVYKNVKTNTLFANQSSFFKVFGGEDPDFIEKAKRLGEIYYLPNMTGYHHVKDSRFTKSFFLWRYWEFGKERAVLEKTHSKAFSFGLTNFLSCLYLFVFKRGRFYRLTQLAFMISHTLARLLLPVAK